MLLDKTTDPPTPLVNNLRNVRIVNVRQWAESIEKEESVDFISLYIAYVPILIRYSNLYYIDQNVVWSLIWAVLSSNSSAVYIIIYPMALWLTISRRLPPPCEDALAWQRGATGRAADWEANEGGRCRIEAEGWRITGTARIFVRLAKGCRVCRYKHFWLFYDFIIAMLLVYL